MAELPGTSSPAHAVTSSLDSLIAAGSLSADARQRRAALVLDRIDRDLTETSARGFLGLLGKPRKVRGAYLVGAVGRGKTMLMDLFFEVAAPREKRRAHFHEFMDEVHAAIAAFRRTKQGRTEDADPVAAAARAVLGTTRLLCLDEFQVQDIADAMLLGRLFERLLAQGVTIVATSNTPPHELYRDGLNRQLVLPFIALLENELDIVWLDGPTDYRRLKFEGQRVFRFGSGPAVTAEMDALWRHLTGGAPAHPATVESLGRRIPVPRAAMGAARFDFAELCEVPLGSRDYLRLAHVFDTVMIDGVPRFDRDRTDSARRFLVLIDTLYDRGIRLAASFAVPLDELCANERIKPEFARAVSRLLEMQSEAYLEAGRREPAAT